MNKIMTFEEFSCNEAKLFDPYIDREMRKQSKTKEVPKITPPPKPEPGDDTRYTNPIPFEKPFEKQRLIPRYHASGTPPPSTMSIKTSTGSIKRQDDIIYFALRESGIMNRLHETFDHLRAELIEIIDRVKASEITKIRFKRKVLDSFDKEHLLNWLNEFYNSKLETEIDTEKKLTYKDNMKILTDALLASKINERMSTMNTPDLMHEIMTIIAKAPCIEDVKTDTMKKFLALQSHSDIMKYMINLIDYTRKPKGGIPDNKMVTYSARVLSKEEQRNIDTLVNRYLRKA